MEITERETWIDNVKVIACILVVLGHFFQSMTKAGILAENNLYGWFEQTIYYFHVPLFFICSGYLYQKFSRVNNLKSWGRNVLKKLINLGVPYFVFSFVTWFLKNAFSGSVNGEVGGLTDTLLIHPTSPYWYLYGLFFIFLITPTFQSKAIAAAGLAAALVFKGFAVFFGGGCAGTLPAVSYILADEIWFVFGMIIAFGNLPKMFSRPVGAILGTAFVIISLFVWRFEDAILSFLMGVMACAAVCMIIEKYKTIRYLDHFAKYTMPIFLMHTLFAAPCRVILLKLGIDHPLIQIVLGIAVSFMGPVIAMIVLERIKLDFLVYPIKVLRKKKDNG